MRKKRKGLAVGIAAAMMMSSLLTTAMPANGVMLPNTAEDTAVRLSTTTTTTMTTTTSACDVTVTGIPDVLFVGDIVTITASDVWGCVDAIAVEDESIAVVAEEVSVGDFSRTVRIACLAVGETNLLVTAGSRTRSFPITVSEGGTNTTPPAFTTGTTEIKEAELEFYQVPDVMYVGQGTEIHVVDPWMEIETIEVEDPNIAALTEVFSEDRHNVTVILNAIAPGETVLTATSADGFTKSVPIVVVEAPTTTTAPTVTNLTTSETSDTVCADGIELSGLPGVMMIGANETLTAHFQFSEIASFAIEDESIARIEDDAISSGNSMSVSITALSAGKTILTVTAKNGYQARFEVFVAEGTVTTTAATTLTSVTFNPNWYTTTMPQVDLMVEGLPSEMQVGDIAVVTLDVLWGTITAEIEDESIAVIQAETDTGEFSKTLHIQALAAGKTYLHVFDGYHTHTLWIVVADDGTVTITTEPIVTTTANVTTTTAVYCGITVENLPEAMQAGDVIEITASNTWGAVDTIIVEDETIAMVVEEVAVGSFSKTVKIQALAEGKTTLVVTGGSLTNRFPIVVGDSETETVLYGDVNTDGVTDLLDVIVLNKSLAGLIVLSEQQMLNGNCHLVDRAATVNEEDVSALLLFVTMSIEQLPIMSVLE